MGCPGCPDGQDIKNIDKQNNQILNSPTAQLIICPNSHKLFIINKNPLNRCIKFLICKKKEKEFREYCSLQQCSDWTDDLDLETKCPICGKEITYCYMGVSISIHPFTDEDSLIKGVKNIDINGNTINVELIYE